MKIFFSATLYVTSSECRILLRRNNVTGLNFSAARARARMFPRRDDNREANSTSELITRLHDEYVTSG